MALTVHCLFYGDQQKINSWEEEITQSKVDNLGEGGLGEGSLGKGSLEASSLEEALGAVSENKDFPALSKEGSTGCRHRAKISLIPTQCTK